MRWVLTKLVCNMYFEQQGCRTQVQMTKWLRCKGMHPSKTAMRNKTLSNAWPNFCIWKPVYQWTPRSFSYKRDEFWTSFFFKDTSQLQTFEWNRKIFMIKVYASNLKERKSPPVAKWCGAELQKARTPLIQEAKRSGRDSKVSPPENFSLP